MSLKFTAAHSSRVNKSASKNPLLRRSSSSLFSSHPRKKAASQSSQNISAKSEDCCNRDRLQDHGLAAALATDLRLRDVAQFLRYIADNMFEDIPERAGMGSIRIAEVLNYRKNLPPVITVAHVHALGQSPTSTEREIAELIQAGIVRKINIPGRGLGTASIGESLVMMDRWVQLVNENEGLSQEVKNKYTQILRDQPAAFSVSAGYFLPHEVVELVKYGFITTTSISSFVPPMLRSESTSFVSLAALSQVGSRNASGSPAAVGGETAFHDAGGGGGAGSGMYSSSNASITNTTEYYFSLPSVGVYLRLLEAARAQMVALLSKAKYKELPKDLLRDRWDGGAASGAHIGAQTGPGIGLAGAIIPAKTRKWKQFYGLRFQWILEECLGTGLVEIFDTGSVGHGVRLA